MTDPFQGDLKLYLDQDGADVNITGGQPEMDPGWNNTAVLGLFAEDWIGNVFMTDAQELESDYVKTAQGTLTLSVLDDIEKSAIRSLQAPAFGTISVEVTNPRSVEIQTRIIVNPPNGDPEEFLTTRNGLTWIAQSTAANKRDQYGSCASQGQCLPDWDVIENWDEIPDWEE